MKLRAVLKEARQFAIPNKIEKAKVSEVVKEVLTKTNSKLKKQKISAELTVGGSVKKGTWLPNLNDVDFFMLFNYKKYRGKNISDVAEKILKKCFKINRLHGSRDYFSASYKGFYMEFVPVLRVTRYDQAENITDCSVLHAEWIAKRAKEIRDEIRLTKLFFKANEVYGAESYIAGFSGHVAEILTTYYGGFLGLLKAARNWKAREMIDLEKHGTAGKINPSKLGSPLVIVDPVEPYRNSAASLSVEKFNRLKIAAKKFLAKPSVDFFREKEFNRGDLIRRKRNRKLIILTAKPGKGKSDVVGSKMLKRFQNMKREFLENDFKISESGWHWKPNKSAVFWFYFSRKDLPKTKFHIGPPVKMIEFAKQFKKKHRRTKVSRGRLVAVLERKYTKPEQLVSQAKTY